MARTIRKLCTCHGATSDIELSASSDISAEAPMSRQRVQSWLALMDQAVVSATSFALTVMVGRSCGSEGLGLYTLGFSVIVMANAVQTALVSTPFTIYLTRRRSLGNPASHAGSSLLISVMLIGIISLLSVAAAVMIAATDNMAAIERVAWAICATLPFFLLREFARRFDFAHMNMLGALSLDTGVTAMMFLGLFYLAERNWVAPESVFGAGGIACAVIVLFWMIRRIRNSAFEFSFQNLSGDLRRDWHFGRWVLIDQTICIAHLYALHWILTGFMSPAATGMLAACGSIAAISSPFLQGMGNFLSPHFARSVSTHSRNETLSLFCKTTMLLVSVMAVFGVLLAVFGESLLQWLYRDPIYVGYGYLVGLLALRGVLVAANITAHHAVLAFENPRASAWASAAGLATTVTTAMILVPTFEINGAVGAALLGATVETAVMYGFFVATLRRWDWRESNMAQPTSST